MKIWITFLILVFSLWSLSPLRAVTNTNMEVLFGTNYIPGSAVDLNFAQGRFHVPGATGTLSDVRASSKTCQFKSDSWETVSNNMICNTDQGALIEETRTNLVPNNSATGAVAGTPGTLPTGWTASLAGLSQQVVGVGTYLGLPYVDVRLFGTTTGQFVDISYQSTFSLGVGSTYSASSGSYLVSTPNIANLNGCYTKAYDGVTNYISSNYGASSIITSYSFTLRGSFIQSSIECAMKGASGQTLDVTLRIVTPQLELNPSINSSVASATVNAAGTLYIGTSGTMTWSGANCSTNPVLNVTAFAGGISGVTSVANAGSCTTFPASSATTWTPGGGLSVGTGASFNLTPANNAAQAFATSPILTIGSTVQRAADQISIAVKSCPNPSLLVIGTPEGPTGYPVAQIAGQVDDDTTNNYLLNERVASTGGLSIGAAVSGASGSAAPSGTWAQNTSGKISSLFSGGTIRGVFNNGNQATGSLAGAISLTVMRIGGGISGTSSFNGYISRGALACYGQSLLNE